MCRSRLRFGTGLDEMHCEYSQALSIRVSQPVKLQDWISFIPPSAEKGSMIGLNAICDYTSSNLQVRQ